MKKGVGIDLGASYIRVATPEKGLIACEPSFVAFDKNSSLTLDIGEAALTRMRGSASVDIMRPFAGGLLANRNATKYVLGKIADALHGSPDKVAVGIPCRFSDGEVSDIKSLLTEAGFRNVTLAETPTAAMVGCNMTPEIDSVFVDIGSHTTDIVLYLGGKPFYSDSFPVGGDRFDTAVAEYLEARKNLRVRLPAAELLKMRIGCAWNDGSEKEIRVTGTDTVTGNQTVQTVTSTELMEAFTDPVREIVEHICGALRHVSLNRVDSTFKNGIYLVGGGSTLPGFSRLITELVGVHATLVPQAEDVVALGLARIASADTSIPSETAFLSHITRTES